MATVVYPYVGIPLPPNDPYPQGTTAYRPLVVATIKTFNGESIRWLVLPDSGADACLFPLALAIILKIDVLNLPKSITSGVGNGANLTYYDRVFIDLGNGIAFTSFVGFTQGMDKVGLGLLGQAGFFEYYNVEFMYSKRTFTIKTI
jgi:hypothetical protein